MKSYKYEFEKQKNKAGRTREITTAEDAVNDLIAHYQLQPQFTELDVKDAWRTILGDSVARRTQQLQIKGNKMYVQLESSALKSELLMRKTFILQKLNLHTGDNPIEELIFN